MEPQHEGQAVPVTTTEEGEEVLTRPTSQSHPPNPKPRLATTPRLTEDFCRSSPTRPPWHRRHPQHTHRVSRDLLV